MRTYFWIALRYLVNFKRAKFVSFMTLISVLGVAIGVMTLIIVLGVMSGFDRDLKSKILGLNYDLIIEKPIGVASNDKIFDKLSNFPDVSGYSPFVSGQALLMSDERFMGVHIRGIDLAGEMKINNIGSFIKVGANPIARGQLLVGEELFKELDLRLGQKINVFSPITNKHYPFTIGGIFKSGYYDYDLNLVFSSLEDAQRLMFMDGFFSGIGIKAKNSFTVSGLKEKLKTTIGDDYQVRTWTELNRTFFAALTLEKITMFIILTLIVLVAAFNIISTLSVLVTDKTKDIGILKSIGLSSKGINTIFMLVGLLIGSFGIIMGTGLGLGLCVLLKKYQFIRLPADIYYIQYLPVFIRWSDVGLIILAAFVISLLFTIYPARRAGFLNPVEALRYE